MLRNRVLLMVALLAITGTMAAMAYTTANVHSPATGTVVHTNVALLALNCNDGIGRNDEVCESHTDGRLHLNFAKGLGTPGTPGAPGLYGFQPGSTYTFNDLVKVTNNSNDTVDVSVAMDPALSTLTITVDETHLGPGDTALVSFSFTVPDEWGVPDKFPTGDEQYPFTGTMVINAVATAP